MNADFMRDAVSRFGDDPEGIGHFRKVVIGLAIAGKLTGEGQLLSPAEMLDQIESEKIRLVRDGQISRPKRYGPVTDDQLPEVFSAPSSFVPLGAVARIEKGLTGIQAAKSGSFPLVVTAAERASCDHFDFEGAATIVPLVSSTGHGNASINRLHYQEGRFALGTILAAIFPYAPKLISARFIFEYLSTFKDELLVSRMTGTANVTLSVGRIAEVPVPLICPSIQRRADELMALCDQLEAARTEREAARDTFTLSTLAKLNTPDPETFGEDARFALANLAPLTARPDQIKQLRQTILNLAVRGKLVEQDAADEPASELLKRIKTANASDGQKRRGKTRDTSAGNALEDIPFDAPKGWTFACLGELVRVLNGRAYKQQELLDKGTPVLRVGNLFTSNHWYYSDLALDDDKHCDVGDLIYAWSASFGPFIWNGPRVIYHYHIWKLPLVSEADLDKRYLYNFLLQKTREIKEAGHGISMVHMTKEKMEKLIVPLPPLVEQHRIVAKVDELMALCDQLEASLTTGEQTRCRLLEAVLHNALEPA